MARTLRVALGVATSILLGASGLRAASTTSGEPDAEPAATTPRVIEITVIGSAAALASVRGAVAPDAFPNATLRWQRSQQLRAADLLPKVEPRADVAIRSFVDLADPAHARLYFSDRAAERFLIRDLELSGRLDELDREALSQAFELSVRALLEDRLAGMSREEARSIILPRVEPAAPEQEPVAARAPRREARSGPAAGVFWGGAGHSRELGVMQGPGLTIAYDVARRRARVSAWASAQYRFEREHQSELVGVSLRQTVLRVGADFVHALGNDWLFAGARLGAGVDVARFTPAAGSAASTAVLEPPGNTGELLLAPGALLGAEIGASLRLTLALAAEIALTRAHYDVSIDGELLRVVEPWPVRPGLALAVQLH